MHLIISNRVDMPKTERINLFELTDKNDIKVRSNDNIRENIKFLITRIKNKNSLSWKETARLFGISYETLWDYCNRSENVPLIFLKNASERLDEKETLKYEQLKFYVVNKNINANNIDKKIDVLFPKTRANIVNYRDVINSIKRLENSNKEPTFKNIKIELNRGKTVVYEYLRKLEIKGLLKTNKTGLVKLWNTNKEVQHA